jgi:hypothetical protein
MGKKTKSNIYEIEQNNKKHRKKSKKLEKREKHKKNKKAFKKEKHQKRKLEKYIINVFKENKKEIDLARLPLDFEEISKQVKKLLTLNVSSQEEIPELFRIMEEENKEVDISNLEDKQAQKYILKLMKNLKIHQSSKNPFAFKIRKIAKDPKLKYTTNVEDIISDTLSSYYYLIKSIFEYYNYTLNNENSEQEESINDELKEKNDNLEKIEIDYEYEEMDNKFGNNSEFINKAFHKIMQNEEVNNDIEDEEELIGPPVPKFLESTMSLIKNDSLDEILKNSYSKPSKNIKNTSSNVEPVNKDSYDKLIAFERERMKIMQDKIEEYDSKYRSVSLLEQHQMKKGKKNENEDMLRPFDRERDLNVVNNKTAIKLMTENKGLKGRFEVKEKYVGY